MALDLTFIAVGAEMLGLAFRGVLQAGRAR